MKIFESEAQLRDFYKTIMDISGSTYLGRHEDKYQAKNLVAFCQMAHWELVEDIPVSHFSLFSQCINSETKKEEIPKKRKEIKDAFIDYLTEIDIENTQSDLAEDFVSLATLAVACTYSDGTRNYWDAVRGASLKQIVAAATEFVNTPEKEEFLHQICQSHATEPGFLQFEIAVSKALEHVREQSATSSMSLR